MVSYVLTELVDVIRNDNPDLTMPSVIDMYYNKDAKCPRLPWEVSKDMEVGRSIAGSDDELADEDDRESESSLMGSQGVPTEHTTEASRLREGDQSLFDEFGDVAILHLEEPDVQQNESATGDKSGLTFAEVPSMTAHGSGDYTDRLEPRVSRSDRVPDVGLSAGTDVMCPTKTFVGQGQRLGRVARFDMAASPHDV